MDKFRRDFFWGVDVPVFPDTQYWINLSTISFGKWVSPCFVFLGSGCPRVFPCFCFRVSASVFLPPPCFCPLRVSASPCFCRRPKTLKISMRCYLGLWNCRGVKKQEGSANLAPYNPLWVLILRMPSMQWVHPEPIDTINQLL